MSVTDGAVSGTFVSLLDDREWAALLELGTHRGFSRGAVLMYEGEPGERVMILEEGRVKVTRIETGGHETMLSIRDPGDLLGEVSVIDAGPRLATITALERVRALVIASSVFRGHLERVPRVAVAVLEVEMRRFRETTLKRSEFAASDTVGRLAARIVDLSERYGAEREEGIVIDLALTQDEIAAWVGASRAGVAKAFQTLRELGWLETHRRRLVVLQLDALRRRAA
jgi:CRP-like cAMP-binding protein